MAVVGAGEVVSGLAELDGHLVEVLGSQAVAEHEVRVAPRGLGSLHLERVVVVALQRRFIHSTKSQKPLSFKKSEEMS